MASLVATEVVHLAGMQATVAHSMAVTIGAGILMEGSRLLVVMLAARVEERLLTRLERERPQERGGTSAGGSRVARVHPLRRQHKPIRLTSRLLVRCQWEPPRARLSEAPLEVCMLPDLTKLLQAVVPGLEKA